MVFYIRMRRTFWNCENLIVLNPGHVFQINVSNDLSTKSHCMTDLNILPNFCCRKPLENSHRQCSKIWFSVNFCILVLISSLQVRQNPRISFHSPTYSGIHTVPDAHPDMQLSIIPVLCTPWSAVFQAVVFSTVVILQIPTAFPSVGAYKWHINVSKRECQV